MNGYLRSLLGDSSANSANGLAIAMVLLSASIATSASPRSGHVDVEECIVRFSEEVKVPAMETGRVAEVSVVQNAVVEAGALIARLEDHLLLIRRHSALLRLQSAKSDSNDDVEVRYAEVALAEAQAELETSRSIQNDVRGAIPMTQVRRLRLAVERGELEVAQAQKRKRQAEIEAQLRQADLSVIDDQLKNLQSESPIAGVVLNVNRSKGEWIEKGETIATIGRLDRLHVHALVNGLEISPSICRGLPVAVHWVDAASGEPKLLRGRVLSVDPQTLPGNRFRLHAEIINETETGDPELWKLHPGASVGMKVYLSASAARRSSNTVHR